MTKLFPLCALLLLHVLGAPANAGLVLPPAKLAELDIFDAGSSTAWDSAANKNYVYVVSSIDPRSEPNVAVVDFSDPYHPSVANSGCSISWHCYGCDYSDGKLYVGAWFSGVASIDTGNGPGLNLMSLETIPYATWTVKVVGDRLYAISDGLYVLDISNPVYPAVLGSYTNIQYPGHCVAIKNNIVYVSDDHRLYVLDCSDPTSITKITELDMGACISALEWEGNNLYVGTNDDPDSEETFTILDISEPWNPQWLYRNGVRDGQVIGDINCNSILPAGPSVFVAHNWGLVRYDVSNPADPRVKSLTPQTGGGGGLSANGGYCFGVGSKVIPKTPEHDNYTRGVLSVYRIFDPDPDNAAPAKWRKLSPTGGTFETQYDCSVLPTAATPAWQLDSGSETYASVADGAVRVNDSVWSASKTFWRKSWNAMSSYGTTVVFRAKCAAQSGSLADNIMIRDGRYYVNFCLQPTKIIAKQTNQQYSLTGSNWHTYRVAMIGNVYRLYVDESHTPALVGGVMGLSYPYKYRTEVVFGGGSDGGTQDISFDYVNLCDEGVYAPPLYTTDTTPDVSVDVWDIRGLTSLSGINRATAQAFYSTDGGTTWNPAAATCSGANGDEHVRITAAGVPFNQLSPDLNKIKFRVSDRNGNVGESPVYPLRVATDAEAPAPVTNFIAVGSGTQTALSWKNSISVDSTATMIRYKTTGYPTGPADGTLLIEKAGVPEADGSTNHNITTAGTYYYAAFARDAAGNYSVAATATANPGTAALYSRVTGTSSITVDGSPSDWNLSEFTGYSFGEQRSTGEIVVVGWEGGSLHYGGCSNSLSLPANESDHTAKVYSLHSSTNLYFLVRVDDSDLRFPDPATSNYNNDCVEIYIDPSHNHGASPMSNSNSDVRLVIDAANQKCVYNCLGTYTTTITNGTTSAVTRDATGWWLELRISKTALDPDLRPNNGTFGLDFAFHDNDNDNDPAQSTSYGWSDSMSAAAYPSTIADKWGNCTLTDISPASPVAWDDGVYTGSRTKLHCSWAATPGATQYRYAIGTSSGGTSIVDWTTVGDVTEITHEGLSLSENGTYYFSVKAGNQFDYWGSYTATNGIKTAAGVTIPEAKGLADGQIRAVRGKTVSAVFPGGFYVQEPNGTSGIKVLMDVPATLGDCVDVAGRVDGSGLERFIDATGNALTAYAPAPGAPRPVAMSTVSLGGIDFNSTTPGALGSLGPNNVGLLVTVWGKVTASDNGFFYLDDGSHVQDVRINPATDSPYAGVRVATDTVHPLVGEYWAATGISSLEAVGNPAQYMRLVLPRNSLDVRRLD